MKIFTLIATLLISTNLLAQNYSYTQKTINTVSDEVCECITDKELKSVNKETLEDCMVKAMTNNMGGLLKEMSKDGDVTDEDFAEDWGEKFGVEVATNLFANCENYVNAFKSDIKTEYRKGKEEKETKTYSTEISFTKVTTGSWAYIVGKENNSSTSFIWLEPFENDNLLIESPDDYIGKTMIIHWQEVQVFDPKTKKYFKAKKVTKLELLG